ncbi:hybrid sensor histidine kinase/response regulator [Seonamhaeicola sp. S2-3]|uniref:hybrid sensor histidine kinase/response regulator transcription factor n=1 Tax=Seonamhaeicola sp. S2-3 TaxID=1936081 RepID=UPI000972B81D|nr:hybrid sensor histidine kinase/response regulator transcription factor [Seonamhaeicola sp. S2-3]APY12495.1 hybrid sensor histidine kinase/response regulator [Seonamhaeicola sp. S2-3]
MRGLNTILACLFVAVSFSQNHKEQIAFKGLTVEHGLSQTSVISIAQDSIGYMWFATQDGLNKYNGLSFKHYNKQFEDITRPTFSKLGKVYIDKQNRLWIITHSGQLEIYRPQTNDFKIIKQPFLVSAIFQDSKRNLFLGSYGNGLFKVDYKTKDTVAVFKGQDTKTTVYNISETSLGVLVAASGSVYKINDSGRYNKILVETSKETNFSVLENNNAGGVWLGSYGNGLFYMSGNSQEFKKYKHDDLPENLNIEDLLIDSKNRLWIATYGKGVYLIDFASNSVKNFKANKNNPFAIHYNDMLCLYEDASGIIWIGSDGTGLSYYDEHLIKFNILTNNQLPRSVNVDMIRSITTDNDNTFWVGTSGKGLTYCNTKTQTYKTYTKDNSPLNSNRVISLDFFENELWIGHQGHGLNIKEASGAYRSFPELNDFTIWSILRASKTSCWLATERHGILLFDKNKGVVKAFNKENSELSHNNIRALVYGNENTLWIGNDYGGVFKLDIETNKISKIKGLDDKVKSLLFLDHTLWVGTYGMGLKKYDTENQTIKNYTKAEGLPNQVVYGILPDEDQNLWLSTNNGLSRFNINNESFEAFTPDDGLQGPEFNTGAYFKDANGTLYFGGLNGLNWFKPENLTYNMVKPKTIISKFEVFSEEQPLNNFQKLKYNQNTVTLTFTSLHFSQPDRNMYKYRLLNYNENWKSPKGINFAHYTNLPPNTYTFEVISSNYDGVWNNEPATFTFTILKPWYLTNLLKTIYVLAIILILFGVYKYLLFRWKVKTQLQLKQAETERLKKLDEFKTKLYTNISHEFRTPLTLITGPIDHQLSKQNISPKDRKELNLIKQNANRLLGLVNQMVDLALIDSGQAQLKIENGNLKILLIQIVSAFQYKAKEKEMVILNKIEGLENVWYDKDVIEKVSSNLLANAIKYAPESSEIIFNANEQENNLVLSVINTNKEITKKDLGKLFQRFYKDDEASEGVGVGLALVKELVSLSKGSIIANSIDSDKIQFTVTLPITKNAFKASEILNSKNTEQEIVLSNAVLNNNNKPCLLIVEDNKDIRTFVKSVFENSYQIIEASNGQAGIEKAIKHMPSLIISDIMMPIKNGIDLCNTLKYNELTSHIPIILLTAKVGEDNEIEGLKTGADAYITKPFSSEKLKLIVEKLIENRNRLQQHFSKSITLTPEITVSSTEAEFLKRLKEVLDKNLTNPDFNTETFSVKMQMSRTQLHRKLKAIVGLSTSEFIRNERLKLAIDLLKKSDNSISEIAYQIGFNTPSYFIKCFKETYNCTPVEYSNRH